LRSVDPVLDVDDETFARLIRRALGHYGDDELVPTEVVRAIDFRPA
jgi:hypothetical protein